MAKRKHAFCLKYDLGLDERRLDGFADDLAPVLTKLTERKHDAARRLAAKIVAAYTQSDFPYECDDEFFAPNRRSRPRKFYDPRKFYHSDSALWREPQLLICDSQFSDLDFFKALKGVLNSLYAFGAAKPGTPAVESHANQLRAAGNEYLRWLGRTPLGSKKRGRPLEGDEEREDKILTKYDALIAKYGRGNAKPHVRKLAAQNNLSTGELETLVKRARMRRKRAEPAHKT